MTTAVTVIIGELVIVSVIVITDVGILVIVSIYFQYRYVCIVIVGLS